MKRALGVLAALMAVATIAWLAGREEHRRAATAPASSPPASAIPTVRGPASSSPRHEARPEIVQRPRPVLPPSLPDEVQAAPASAPGGGRPSFEQEPRDSSWAEDHEREVRLRLRRVVADLARRSIAVDVDAIECRQTLCRIAIHAKAEAALGSFYGALETPSGLAGWADSVVLAPVEVAASGEVTSHVLAWFERD